MAKALKHYPSLLGLVLALGWIALGVVRGEQLASPPLRLAGKMICIGASITSGEGVKPDECYVGLLKAKVAAEKLDLEITGQGRSGWSTGAYVQNKDAVVDTMPADASIVTILLGTNDSREDGTPKEVGERARENLGKLIDLYHAKAPNAQFVVISPTKAFPAILTKRLREARPIMVNARCPTSEKSVTDFERLRKSVG